MSDGWVRSAQYVTMSDGVKIATYTYLPKGLGEGEKVPAIIIPTPYFSMASFRSPFFEKLAAKLAIGGQGEWAEGFARFGYATVLWDLRGSGASFGQKLSAMVPAVIKDTTEILDWIVSQPWCNGNIGATGISARGMITEWMLAAKHPALKAIIPRFTPFDIYSATLVGGLTASRFIRDVGSMLRMMDANRLPDMPESSIARGILKFLGMRIMPMDEDRDGSMLAAAVGDHAENQYLDRDMLKVTYRDDQLASATTEATLDTESPFNYANEMAESGAAIYGFTGWYDGSFPRELINLHLNVRTSGSKLIIGPWGHHAKFNSSPFVKGKQPSRFDQAAELARFFDYHLKGVDSGIGNEAPIHYYTLGEEKWKESMVWPPEGFQERRYYLFRGNGLVPDEPGNDEGVDQYHVDYSAGTGVYSRFGKHLEGGRFPVTYPDRKNRDKKLLTYTSSPLDADMEVTGHPFLTLYASFSSTDGAILAYIEDVQPDGRIFVATDGCLRACFRKLSNEQPPYVQIDPYHTFKRDDAEPLVPGELAGMTFGLFPVSYLFRKGHSIRLSIAGADKDNFVLLPQGEPPTVAVHYGGGHASFLTIPLAPGAT
jgi:hypothetical protein